MEPPLTHQVLTHLGCIDELICQALSNGLDVPEGSLPGTCAQQPDGLGSTGVSKAWGQGVPMNQAGYRPPVPWAPSTCHHTTLPSIGSLIKMQQGPQCCLVGVLPHLGSGRRWPQKQVCRLNGSSRVPDDTRLEARHNGARQCNVCPWLDP